MRRTAASAASACSFAFCPFCARFFRSFLSFAFSAPSATKVTPFFPFFWTGPDGGETGGESTRFSASPAPTALPASFFPSFPCFFFFHAACFAFCACVSGLCASNSGTTFAAPGPNFATPNAAFAAVVRRGHRGQGRHFARLHHRAEGGDGAANGGRIGCVFVVGERQHHCVRWGR